MIFFSFPHHHLDALYFEKSSKMGEKIKKILGQFVLKPPYGPLLSSGFGYSTPSLLVYNMHDEVSDRFRDNNGDVLSAVFASFTFHAIYHKLW